MNNKFLPQKSHLKDLLGQLKFYILNPSIEIERNKVWKYPSIESPDENQRGVWDRKEWANS